MADVYVQVRREKLYNCTRTIDRRLRFKESETVGDVEMVISTVRILFLVYRKNLNLCLAKI